jgi:succinate dehydrogenase / fumarate reductase membrane anchor subunit
VRPAYREGLWPWLLQRVTAVFLAVGLLVHFIAVHFMVKRPLTFDQIRERMATPFWAIFDGLLLACAIYHGLNGVLGICKDYNPRPGVVRFLSTALTVVGVVAFAYGVYVLAYHVQAAQYLALKR